MALFGSLVSWYFRKRMQQVEFAMQNPAEVQQRTFKNLIDTAAQTEWGKLYDYKSIKTQAEYARRVPISTYDEIKPYIERTMKGEQNILWPSEIKWYAKSSGTTSDKSKFIPVSYEALEDCHFRGGRDLLTVYCHNHPETKIFDGKGLMIGGSHKVNSFNHSSSFGDLSAVIMANLPFWVNFLRTPELSIALMDEWEEKIEKMALATVNEDVTNISGVPTWTVVLINRLFELSGKKDLREIWPNLELYMHGGVSFVPYRNQFENLIPSGGMNYMETYNASEGFFGMQVEGKRDDMLLMADYGVYYEFIKHEDLNAGNHYTYTLAEVEPGVNYAVVISTNAGLWRYLLGDTVRFTSVNPYYFKVSGRTKLFINAFGEELMIDNAEAAMAEACKRTNAIVNDYTAAPIYFTDGGSNGAGHEWLIEFDKAPENSESFNEILDTTLKSLNSDYEAKRYKDIVLKPPRVHNLPKGVFHNWLKTQGKLGGQHKIPRLSNDRKIVEEILSLGNNN